jgi:hypothetical protein
MKLNRSFTLITLVALVAITIVVASPATAQRRAAGPGGGECIGGIGALFDEIEIEPLSGEEEDELLFMWEEEKLARDVYTHLSATWQLPIFANIASAEQRHMDLLYTLIETYGFTDQIPEDNPDQFKDPNIAALFDAFVPKGNNSLIDALEVGAEIEDKDLYDLYNLLDSIDNAHIKLVAYNLAKGSRNHLRAFVLALEAQGQVYTATIYLDQATIDAIVDAGMEQHLIYNADGEAVQACGGSVDGFGMRRGQARRGGQSNGDGQGPNGTGSGECDGTGGAQGDCDGTGPHGSGNGSGNGGAS